MNATRETVKAAVIRAEARIRKHILETPLEYSPYLSQLGRCQVYLKLENQQITKSFKFRGAINRILSISEASRTKGVITASTGNHGAAMAHVFKKLGVTGTIYLPKNTAPAKVETLRLTGAPLEFYGEDCLEAENLARRTARERGLSFVSPYNDPDVVGGQGTIAVELLRQLEQFDAVLSPVGGGGLIGGVAGYLKAEQPEVMQVGCQPVNSKVMYESIKAGRLLDLESKPTLADGTAGGIESGSITFDICRECVDDFILVSEDKIREALRLLIAKHYMLVEGAGALSTASFLTDPMRFAGKAIVLVVSGAKISLETLWEVLSERDSQ
jgi:threonine dehydratase